MKDQWQILKERQSSPASDPEQTHENSPAGNWWAADVNARANSPVTTGYTMLEIAANRGDVPLIKLLLRHGANVNGPGAGGWTPLHLAAGGGQLEAIQVLFDAKADINARNLDGQTPLMMAAQNGKRQAAEVLLNAGADPNLAIKGGATPLEAAVTARDETLTREFLDHGADPNPKAAPQASSEAGNGGGYGQHEYGRPMLGTSLPLEIACLDDNIALAKLLLERGANPNA